MISEPYNRKQLVKIPVISLAPRILPCCSSCYQMYGNPVFLFYLWCFIHLLLNYMFYLGNTMVISSIFLNVGSRMNDLSFPTVFATHIVEDNADKNVHGNPEEVQNSTSWTLWDILRSQLHDGWPEYTNTCFKHTKGKELNFSRELHATTFCTWGCSKKLLTKPEL